MTPEKRPTPKR